MSRRLALFLGTLCLAILGWLWIQDFSLTGLQHQPQACTPYRSDGAEGLLELAGEFGFVGVQLSVRDKSGNWLDCAAGWADWTGLGEPMSTEHRMRYLSLSKVLTSALSVKMVRDGRLNLDERLVEILHVGGPYADPRVSQITLRQLLSHTGGFDRLKSGDPMMVRTPWCPKQAQHLGALRLDFSPGERFAYSNLGYCLLGSALEHPTGRRLETLITEELLQPAGLMGLMTVNNGVQRSDEPRLQTHPAEPFDVLNGLDYDSMHATGAWSGTAADFGRLMEKVFLSAPPGNLLDSEGRRLLTDVAGDCDVSKWRHCHGLGLYRYREEGGPTMYWRDGSLNGGTAFFSVSDDGQIVVWVANSRQPNWVSINDRIGHAIYRYFTERAGLNPEVID